jgi:predicted RNA-binding protein associated with RNAse of E/G family
MTSVTVNYHRPGKGLTVYQEELVFEDETCLRTFKVLPPETSDRLSAALATQGLARHGQRIQTIAKVYFFNEAFNLLEFRDELDELVGYYSDIGEPARKLRDGEYEMVDLFLDLWLYANGTLLELDWDEFDEAIANQVITPAQADLARTAMARLKAEFAQKIYPGKYLPHSSP